MKKIWFVIIFNWIHLIGCSQILSFENQIVGVIISRKNLKIDSQQMKFWAHYLQLNDSIGLTEESIKTAVTIKIGHLLQNWLTTYHQAQKVYFLNQGQQFTEFVLSYPFQEKPVSPIGFDKIVSVDDIQLISQNEKIVYNVSNKLVTEIIANKAIEGKISVWNFKIFQKIFENSTKIVENHENDCKETVLSSNLSYITEKLLATWWNCVLNKKSSQ